MLVSKNAKIGVTPNANAKNCQPPMRAGGIWVVLGPQCEGLAFAM